MGNKIKGGYIKIANDLMGALIRHRIPGEVRQVVDAILRKTFGWNKYQDKITLSQFQLMTGMKKPSIIRALNKGIDHKIIYKSANGAYQFRRTFAEWIPFTKKLIVSKRVNPVSQRVNKSLPKSKSPFLITKDTTKDTIQKTLVPSRAFQPPTIEKIKEYTSKENYNIDPERFWDFYQSKGWMVGRNKMKDWKAAVRNWARAQKAPEKRKGIAEIREMLQKGGQGDPGQSV